MKIEFKFLKYFDIQVFPQGSKYGSPGEDHNHNILMLQISSMEVSENATQYISNMLAIQCKIQWQNI